MGLFSIFSNKGKAIEELLEKGAVVVDVRSSSEYRSGHSKGSKNIPLPQIETKSNEILKWNKPVIFCCASGMRSGQATSILKKKGLECINGGSWQKMSRHQ